MSDTVIAASLQLEGQQANQTVKSFKQELKEASAEVIRIQEEFGAVSPQAIAAAKRVAELKDQIQDAREVTALFDPGAKFQALGNVVKTVSGGVSTLAGTMTFFNGESSATVETLQKLTALLSITEGASAIADSVKDFERLGAVLKSNTVIAATWNFIQTGSFKTQTQLTAATDAQTVATEAQAAATATATAATGGASTAMKVLRGALISTGIGAIVIGLGLLIANFDKVKKVVLDFIPGLGKVADFIGSVINTVTDFVGVTSEAERQSAKLIDTIGKNIEKQERFLELNADKYDQYTNRKYQADLQYQKRRLEFMNNDKLSEAEKTESIKQALAQRDRAIKSAIDDRAAADQKVREDESKKVKDAADKAAQERQSKIKEITAKLAQERKEKLAAEGAALDELSKLREENALKEIDDENQRARAKVIQDIANEKASIEAKQISEDTRRQLLTALRQKEINELTEIEEKAEKDRKDKEKAAADELSAKAAAQIDMVNQRADAINKVRDDLGNADKSQYQQQLDDLDEWYRQRYAIIQGNKDLEAELDKQYHKQKREIDQVENENRLNALKDFFGNASQLFEKHTTAYKVFAISQALIDTYQSAISSYKSLSGIPVVGPALGFAAAGVAIAAGFKNIQEIAKVKTPGGSGGGSVPSLASIQAPLAPQAPQVQTTALDTNSLNQIGSATTRAYVLDVDSQSQRERQVRLARAARLGG